jgi:hypothetical protein
VHSRRRPGIPRVPGYRAVGRRLVHADAEFLRQRCVDLVSAEHPAQRVPAHADKELARRAALEHRVEGDDRRHLGLGEVEHLGAEGDAVGRDISLLGLHEVEHRQQRRSRLTGGIPRDDLGRGGAHVVAEDGGIAGSVDVHH